MQSLLVQVLPWSLVLCDLQVTGVSPTGTSALCFNPGNHHFAAPLCTRLLQPQATSPATSTHSREHPHNENGATNTEKIRCQHALIVSPNRHCSVSTWDDECVISNVRRIFQASYVGEVFLHIHSCSRDWPNTPPALCPVHLPEPRWPWFYSHVY